MISIKNIKSEINDIKIRLTSILSILKENNIGSQNIDDMNIVINSLNKLYKNIKE